MVRGQKSFLPREVYAIDLGLRIEGLKGMKGKIRQAKLNGEYGRAALLKNKLDRYQKEYDLLTNPTDG